MSNILDIDELYRSFPVERTHRIIIGTAEVFAKLVFKVIKGEERVRAIEALVVFPMAALYFSIVTRRIGTDQLVLYTKLGGSGFKESL